MEELDLDLRLRSDALRRRRERAEAKNRRWRCRRQMVVVAVLAVGVGLLVAAMLIGGWPGRVATAVGVAAAPVSAVCDGRTLLVRPRRRR